MSLFQRLGGQQAIGLVVEKFYQIMLKDNRVAHYFTTTNMQKQKVKQKQFITLVTGGPNNYEGTDMKTAHCKHSIGHMQFDATWQNLQTALKFFNVPEKQTKQLKTIFYSVQSQIVNKNDQKQCPFKHQLNNSEVKGEEPSSKTLYDRLGGQTALNLVVNTFYDIMLQDPRVSFYFSNTNMQKQRRSQIQFIAMVTGGPNNYTGKDMKTAHCPYKITQGEFDATWQNLQKSLEKYHVDKSLIKQVKQVFYSVQNQIVNSQSKPTAQKKCPFSKPQQQPKHTQTQKSLFDKLGGHGALYLVVNKFYDIMLADPRVNYYFANTNMEKQKTSQIQFLSMVTGGPNTYTGKDMKTAHCPYKIGSQQFDATWENLQKALEYFGVKGQLLKQVKNIFYSVENEIVWKKKQTKHKHQQQAGYIVQRENSSSSQSQKVINKKNSQLQKAMQQIHLPVTMKQSTNILKNHMPTGMKQSTINLQKHHSAGSTSPRVDQSMLLKCPHMKAKLTSMPGQHNLSENDKRRIKQQVINKQLQQKQVKKLSNCPYSKIYY